MTQVELIEPIRPVEPEKNDEDLHELRAAIAAAVTAVSKNKNIIVTSSDVRTWSEPEGQITFKIKKTHALYTEYDKKQREYQQAKRDYDNQVGALKFGVPVEKYIEAKKRYDSYQSKKCEQMPEHELDYFVEKVLTSDAVPELAES